MFSGTDKTQGDWNLKTDSERTIKRDYKTKLR